MLDLHKRLPKTKDAQARTVLEREIASTDKHIDGLVYEPYGLMEKEVGIVEKGAGQRVKA